MRRFILSFMVLLSTLSIKVGSILAEPTSESKPAKEITFNNNKRIVQIKSRRAKPTTNTATTQVPPTATPAIRNNYPGSGESFE